SQEWVRGSIVFQRSTEHMNSQRTAEIAPGPSEGSDRAAEGVDIVRGPAPHSSAGTRDAGYPRPCTCARTGGNAVTDQRGNGPAQRRTRAARDPGSNGPANPGTTAVTEQRGTGTAKGREGVDR